MTNDDLKRKAIAKAVQILVERGFRNTGFLQAKAAGMAAQWITKHYGDDIWNFFTDTFELMIIINKSKIRMNEAQEDYRILQAKKARRIADKIYK